MRSSDTSKIQREFQAIFDAYSDELLGFLITKVDTRDTALDILQETFLRYWQYLVAGKVIEQPRALLYRMARNRVIDHYRTRHSDNISMDIENETGVAEHPEVVESAEGLEVDIDSQIAVKLLDELSFGNREVLVMRFVDDLSVTEIAETLGVTPNTVSIRIHRGISELKKIISERYGKSI